MSTETAATVPARFVEADGIRFAYRRWGKPDGFPLVFMQYFSANLDDWDPLVTDGFAADHDVILFDNAGVASSGGETPGTISEMTRHALAFCDALGLKQFNVVGFSLGGMIAQQLALDYPDRVNRIVLLGTGPRGGEGMTFTELSSEERADPVPEAKARQIVLAARPQGKPRLTDFRVEETAIPTPGPEQVLLRVQFLSLDPYMRGRMDDRESYAPSTPLGGVMPGESVATVVASHHPGYSEGDIVLAQTGWRTHTMSDRADLRKLVPAVAPVTTGLGVLGMPGFTAYGGLREIGRPQPGETVVVAAASGPVGSLVGQLARIAGARAVGIAGGPEKCAYVKDELGFDAVVDHRAADFAVKLSAACPDGIDVYFENVGGAVWQAVLPLLNKFARVPVSGLVAHYSDAGQGDGPDRLAATMREILFKSLTVRGFINYDFAAEHYPAFLREVGAGIADGRIRYREDFVDGLEKAPEAFIGMLEGRNFGKLIVRVCRGSKQ